MNRLCKLTACAGVCALTLVTSAVAQTGALPMIVNVPFSFYVSNREMPPGEYMIGRATIKAPTTMLVRSAFTRGDKASYDSDYSVAITPPGFLIGKTRNKARPRYSVVFNTYSGDRHFLSEIWSDAETLGVQLPKCRRERELITSFVITKAAPNQVVILARAIR